MAGLPKTAEWKSNQHLSGFDLAVGSRSLSRPVLAFQIKAFTFLKGRGGGNSAANIVSNVFHYLILKHKKVHLFFSVSLKK